MTRCLHCLFNIWPFDIDEKLPNGVKKSAKVGSKFCQILNQPCKNLPFTLKSLQKCKNFAESGHTGFCPRHFIDDVNNRRYVQSHNRCPLKTHYQLRTFEKIVVSKYWPTLLQHIFVKLTHCCTQIRFINERLSKTMIGR